MRIYALGYIQEGHYLKLLYHSVLTYYGSTRRYVRQGGVHRDGNIHPHIVITYCFTYLDSL